MANFVSSSFVPWDFVVVPVLRFWVKSFEFLLGKTLIDPFWWYPVQNPLKKPLDLVPNWRILVFFVFPPTDLIFLIPPDSIGFKTLFFQIYFPLGYSRSLSNLGSNCGVTHEIFWILGWAQILSNCWSGHRLFWCWVFVTTEIIGAAVCCVGACHHCLFRWCIF